MTDTEIRKALWGANLEEARTACALTKADVARALNITYQSVQDWESGRTEPTTDNQIRLIALYGKTRDELFPIEDES